MLRVESIERKIIPIEELDKAIGRWELKGQRVVFTNGVFDILHRGHVTLLAEAKAMGHLLVLGLNSDASVRTLGKGSDRPINKEQDRAFVLGGLSSVDAIVIFDDSTPYKIIRQIEPAVLIKGGDYDPNQTNSQAKNYVVGSDLQREGGRDTVCVDLVNGYSTTSMVKKMSDGEA
ncbi:adenylyltransferase/cytidyltransferase family protein [Cryomorpha ignava]|uniref:Adenylyltransferase/cytidyltransferase family protein n=1 Tax=Cryomorpha ignava TaxID=101383 RepID=A0A7K3WMC7_9FLAO|nr:adenylyltransferase/cytidyltransferase family protein [Cryomorpha ignava]NEN22042.1 adenylyltransferase/cytidyltransferase family protein [Cryomorpha ignava]